MALALSRKKTEQAASERPKAKTAGKRSSVHEKGGSGLTARILAVPARIMAPRLLYILSVIALCVIGLVMIYSASSITAYNDYHNASYYLDRQVIFLIIGVVVCIILSAVPYEIFGKPAVFLTLWVIACGMLCLTAFGGGVSALGAERSIMIGSFALQPAEFAKIAVVLALCALVAMQRTNPMEFKRFVVTVVIATLIPLFLIYRQPDLGTAIILAVGLITMSYLAGLSWKVIAGLVGLLAGYAVIACITQPYHLERVISMFDPWLDPNGDGYQSIQSLYAFGNGGLFGTGLGLSRQKYLYLPYAHTDFIFAIIGEELGFIGAGAVVLLFGVFIFSGMRIARMAPDLFGCLVAGSLTVMVGFQACVNMACVCGIAPVTGKALPFVSYGGSSLVATLITVGITLSVSLHSRVGARYERKRDDFLVIEGKKAVHPTEKEHAKGSGPAEAGRGVAVRAGHALSSLIGRAGSISRAEGSHRTGAGSRSDTRTAEGTSRSARSSATRPVRPGAASRTGSSSRFRRSSSRTGAETRNPSASREKRAGSSGRTSRMSRESSSCSTASRGFDSLGLSHTTRRSKSGERSSRDGYDALDSNRGARSERTRGQSRGQGRSQGRGGRGSTSSRRGL